MENLVNGPEIPMGLGMALAQNRQAMDAFAALPKERQEALIAGTHQIASKEEMQAYVQKLTEATLV